MADKPFSNIPQFGGTATKKSGHKKGLVITFTILGLITVIFVGIVAYQAFNFIAGVRDNWSELQFAYQKPAIVKAIRIDYQKKEATVEASYKEHQQTAQDQLIQQVTNQLQGSSK